MTTDEIEDEETRSEARRYAGRAYVRPLGRGIVLSDLSTGGETEIELEEWLPEGNYVAELIFVPVYP